MPEIIPNMAPLLAPEPVSIHQVPERPDMNSDLIRRVINDMLQEMRVPENDEFSKLASRIEDYYWADEEDAERVLDSIEADFDVGHRLLNMVESISVLVDKRHKEALAHWSEIFPVVPEFGVGDVISFYHTRTWQPTLFGLITKISGDPQSPAKYYVLPEEDMACGPGDWRYEQHRRFLVPFECARAASQEDEQRVRDLMSRFGVGSDGERIKAKSAGRPRC